MICFHSETVIKNPPREHSQSLKNRLTPSAFGRKQRCSFAGRTHVSSSQRYTRVALYARDPRRKWISLHWISAKVRLFRVSREASTSDWQSRPSRVAELCPDRGRGRSSVWAGSSIVATLKQQWCPISHISTPLTLKMITATKYLSKKSRSQTVRTKTGWYHDLSQPSEQSPSTKNPDSSALQAKSYIETIDLSFQPAEILLISPSYNVA